MDLLSPELVANPHPWLHRLRARDPVCWSPRHRAWLLLRYDDVVAGFRDPAFSSERVADFVAEAGAGPDDEERGPIARVLSSWMSFRDPPDHSRLRRLVQKAFTPRVAEKLRPRIQEIVHGLLDDLARDGGGDFVRGFAFPLPAIVIAELLGVPAEDRDLFKGWSEDIKGLVFGSPDPARLERARHGFECLSDYFGSLLERFRSAPGDNLLSALAAAEEQGDLLSSDELVGTCVLLLFGGHETTTNLLSTGLLALHQNPRERARLLADPDLYRSAVEEILRWDGPLKLMVRWAREPRAVRGVEIRAGDRVFLVQTAANRDPERFPDPDRFDLGRGDNAHLAFGHGIHFCLGAPLARLEAQIGLRTVLTRFSGFQVETDTPEWQPSILGRALQRLPVSLG